jgi:hypothetical protein
MAACQEKLTNAKTVWSRNLDKNPFTTEAARLFAEVKG